MPPADDGASLLGRVGRKVAAESGNVTDPVANRARQWRAEGGDPVPSPRAAAAAFEDRDDDGFEAVHEAPKARPHGVEIDVRRGTWRPLRGPMLTVLHGLLRGLFAGPAALGGERLRRLDQVPSTGPAGRLEASVVVSGGGDVMASDEASVGWSALQCQADDQRPERPPPLRDCSLVIGVLERAFQHAVRSPRAKRAKRIVAATAALLGASTKVDLLDDAAALPTTRPAPPPQRPTIEIAGSIGAI